MAFHRDIVAFHSHAGTVLVASGADPEIAVWKKRLNQRRFPPAGAQVLRHARDAEMSKVRVLLFEADGRSHHRTDVRAMQAIEHAIETGRLSAVYLPTHAVHRHGSGDLVGSPRLTITPMAARGRAPTVGGMDGPNRLLFMLQRMPRFLGGPMLAAFNDLVSTRSLMALAASLVVFTLAQAVGVGEALDAALAAWAYSRARIAGLQALWDLLVACHDAWDAQSEGEIDAAGKRFAAALTVLGIALLSAILVFAARRLRGGKAEEEPEQIQRISNKRSPRQRKPPETPSNPPNAKPGTGSKFANDAKLQDHYQRHGADFGAKSAGEYQTQADSFLTGPKGSGVLERTRANGDVVRYNPKTDEFGVVSNKTIRTYYKPDPSVHGKSSNLDYFNAQ